MTLLSTYLVTSLLAFSSPFVKSLISAKTKNVDEILNPSSILVIFQADCSACKRQIMDLKCLEDKFQINLLGAFSTEEEMRREYFKLKTSYPGYYASQDILHDLGVSGKSSPQIVYRLNDQTSRRVGYIPCEKMNLLLSEKVKRGGHE